MSFAQMRLHRIKTLLASSTCYKRSCSSGKENKHYNVIIAGGGAVGGTLAHHLSNVLPSLSVAVMDTKTPKSPKEVLLDSAVAPSARAYALSPKSLELLGARTLDRLKEEGRIASYEAMQVRVFPAFLLHT